MPKTAVGEGARRVSPDEYETLAREARERGAWTRIGVLAQAIAAALLWIWIAYAEGWIP